MTKYKVLGNKKGFAFLTSVAIFIGLILALGITLFIVGGVIINVIVKVVIITIGLLFGIAFALRITGFNPASLEVKDGKLDNMSWILAITSIGLLIGLPYLTPGTIAVDNPFENPMAFSMSSLNDVASTIGDFWIYMLGLFVFAWIGLFVVKKKRRR